MIDKKPIEQLVAEHAEFTKYVGKIFVHHKSQQTYQLLFTAHDTESQELMAVYCLCAMTKLKFTRSMAEFLEKFEERK